MPVYEIEANGKVYEVEAPDPQAAVAAMGAFSVPAAPEGQPDRLSIAPAPPPEAPPLTETGMPEGMVLNPATGQVVDMPSPNNPYVREGRGRALMQGAGQGLSFGGMDEAVAGLSAATGGDYGFTKAVMDEELRRARDQHPVAAIGGELAGGVASGLAATGGIAPATTLAGKVAQAAGIGGGTGAVYGALSADGGAAERAKGGLLGGLFGASAGVAAVPVEWGLRTIGGTAAGALANISGKAKPARVETALAQALAASGRTPQQLADDVANGPSVYALADALGTPGQRTLSGTARLGGTARREITDFLEGRQAGQGERIAATLAEALGSRPRKPGTDLIPWRQMMPEEEAAAIARAAAARNGAPLKGSAEQTRARMTAARGKAADKAYDAARKGADPVDVRGALAAIDDRIGPMRGSGIKGDGIDARLADYRARLAAGNPAKSRVGSTAPAAGDSGGYTSVELSDFDRVLGVKQAVQDDIGAAVRAGRNNEARELQKVVTALDEALEGASPDYRAANDAFRKASREIDQIDAGKAAGAPSRRAEDVTAEYGKLTPEEQAAYRAGYADRQLAKIEGAAVGVDKSRPFTSPKSQAELAAMARDPKALADALGRERVMFETRRQAIGGSQTADNLADMAGLTGIIRRGMNPMDLISTGAEWVSRMSKGQNDATRAALARALMSTGNDAAENIAKAVARGEALSQEQQLALQTILYLQQNGALQAAR